MKTALVTGITGQTGSYLAELLLNKGYEVHGIMRRTSSIENSTWRIMNVIDKLHLHEGDLCDAGSLDRIVTAIQPDEIYNLGAQSHVAVSFQVPEHTGDVIALGTLRLLEAVRKHAPNARFYQASTSEMFGASAPPQGETTMFHPRSPYGVAKLAAHWYTINARESYGLHASCGILFNHESPRRGETFVTRKITKAVAAIAIGTQEKVALGNLNALRDWGFAGDYVRAMWMMLQQEQPGDYVIATGETHSVREFVKAAFDHVGLDWTKHVEIDPKFCRPAEVHALCGNPFKAHAVLGWTPEVSFTQLVKMMVDYDLALAQHEQATGMVKRVVVPSTST